MTMKSVVAKVEDGQQKFDNYVVRHWRGQLSLPISYWVNYAFLTTGTGGALNVAYAVGLGASSPFVALALLGACVAAYVWSVVGVWRSANNHIKRTGRYGWATTTQTIIAVNIFMCVVKISVEILKGWKS